jgi:cell volume regulation protein A
MVQTQGGESADVHFGNEFILVGAALVVLAIIAGMFSSRLGAPLLLVFLGLGMVAGEDGLGIEFSDFHATYLVGSMALAVILFDGGLRTPRATFRIALWPALSLATIGVVVTALIAGAIAVHALAMTPLQGFLVGATVASTDAAAVFILLHARGTEIAKRVSATLELESGINDPMAIFLTVIAVEWLLQPDFAMSGRTLLSFALQMGGGALIGVVGGYALLQLINRVEIAAGLYPILAVAVTLIIFAGAQSLNASGFLAVYLAGLILGNHRHRAHAVISRFHDGLAWLAQIVMFLMLGLLVTPSDLFHGLSGEVVLAVSLILVARPVAVWLGLAPFRFTWREKSFIAWVGLRGAVPIFLASIPVIAGVPDGHNYFNVAFVVVLFSLVIQGWTVGRAARVLGLELPPPPDAPERQDIELPTTIDREAAGWAVAQGSPALAARYGDLHLPKRTRIIAVIRDGTLMNRATLERLEVGDYIIALVPPEQVIALDKLFSTPIERRGRPSAELGEFVFEASVRLGQVCNMYGVPFEPLDHGKSLADFLHDRLGQNVVVGDRVKIGEVELIVHEMQKNRIAKVGLEVEPEAERLPILRFWNRVRGILRGAG